ncbi:hypothetical protein FQA39_LY06142 [Lamprigera yunnana]|nr:hypothetical protein FQA39_LY06142 [Lamprigera yunnana]
MNFLTRCDITLENFKKNPAIYYWDETNIPKQLSYFQVSNLCKSLTAILKKVIHDKLICVGLYMQKHLYIPSLIISLQKRKLAFTFLDPHTADQSNITLIKRINMKWIISTKQEHSKTFLSRFADEVISFNDLIIWKISTLMKNFHNFKDIMYVIATSGTTGEPKIVKVPEKCIMSNINHLRNIFKLTESDVIFYGTPLTFDPSIVELFLAITTGCALVMPLNMKFNYEMYDVLFPKNQYYGVTVLQIVPSLFLKWAEKDIKRLLQNSSCRILAFGGEKFPQSVLSLPKSDYLRIFNLYGITEVSCWASISEVTNCNSTVTLGEALSETELEVRNNLGVKVIDGDGELYIGSNCRICYINNEEHLNLPVFRATGDYVRIKNNQYFYLARTNAIIKRLGHKVNLLEIEETIFSSINISSTCLWFENQNKLVLVAEIKEIGTSNKEKIKDKFRVKLLQILPQKCFPDDIEIVPSFPVTKHGKIDSKTLANIYTNLIKTTGELEITEMFKLLWCKYLGLSINDAGAYLDHSFFDLGGTSINALQFLSEFKERLGYEYPSQLNVLFFERTLSDCYDFIKNLEYKHQEKNVRVSDDCNVLVPTQLTINMSICWKHCLDACVDSSPTVISNRMIAIGSFSHKFSILDCTNGNVISQLNLPNSIESGCCVSICGKYVYTGCYDGTLYCIEIKTGNIIWKYSTYDQIKCTPCIKKGSDFIVFGSYDKYLYCVNYNNGNLIWKSYLCESITSDVIFYKNYVYVSTILGTCFGILIETGEKVWQHNTGNPMFGSPVLISDLEYIIWIDVQGTVHTFSYRGEKKWSLKVDGNVYSSPVKVNNSIVFGSSDCKLYYLNVNDNFGQVQRTIMIDSDITSTPFIFDYKGKTLCSAATKRGFVYIIDYLEATILGKLQLPGEIFSSPKVVEHMIYIGCRDNNIYCIKIENKESAFP